MAEGEPITLTATIALLGILPVAVLLFLFLPARLAAAATYLAGWLFLPQAVIDVPGALPDWDRVTAIGLSVLGGVVVLNPARLALLRPSLLDLPLVVYCLLVPLASSITNGLGAYDGFATALNVSMSLFLPYLVGRMYFSDPAGLRALALTVFLAGLIYVPLCLWEIRMSPQLHRTIYGYHQHTFYQSYRMGGFRPIVFLQHGLAVGMLMSCATLMGLWLWLSKSLGRWQAELAAALGVLAVTTLLCKSLGALLLLTAGVGTLLAVRHLGTALPLLLLTAIPPTYMTVRSSGNWASESAVQLVKDVASPERAQSFEFRLVNEDLLVGKALEQPLFGWGGWNRGKVENAAGKTAIADGMWVVVLSRNGLFGLVAFTLLYLIPVWLFVWRAGPASGWSRPELAGGAALATMLALYSIDNLMNAMFSPFNVLAMGGLIGWSLTRSPARPGGPAWNARPGGPAWNARPGGPAWNTRAAGPGLTANPLLGLRAAALRRWGRAEVARREALARRVALALPPALQAAYAARYQALLLTLDEAQLPGFMAAEPRAQRELVDRWLGLVAEPAAAPTGPAPGRQPGTGRQPGPEGPP